MCLSMLPNSFAGIFTFFPFFIYASTCDFFGCTINYLVFFCLSTIKHLQLELFKLHFDEGGINFAGLFPSLECVI